MMALQSPAYMSDEFLVSAENKVLQQGGESCAPSLPYSLLKP